MDHHRVRGEGRGVKGQSNYDWVIAFICSDGSSFGFYFKSTTATFWVFNQLPGHTMSQQIPNRSLLQLKSINAIKRSSHNSCWSCSHLLLLFQIEKKHYIWVLFTLVVVVSDGKNYYISGGKISFLSLLRWLLHLWQLSERDSMVQHVKT